MLTLIHLFLDTINKMIFFSILFCLLYGYFMREKKDINLLWFQYQIDGSFKVEYPFYEKSYISLFNDLFLYFMIPFNIITLAYALKRREDLIELQR